MGAYRIIIKKKGSLEYPLTIIYIVLFVILASLYSFIPEKLVGFLFSLFIFSGIVIAIFNSNRIRKVKGTFQGVLEFQIDKIIINEKVYLIDELQFIVFDVTDYIGKVNIGTIPVDPRMSNGTGNWVELIKDNGNKIKTFFQLEYENQFVSENKENLISYCKKDKISFGRLIDILGNSQKATIEKLKKEIEQ